MIGLAERVDFLANSHLFNGLSREQLEQVASRLEERGFRAGEAILSPELSTRALFLIVKGKVRLQYIGRQKKERLSYLVPGDYFGEETILKTSRRKKLSAWAEEECLLLVLHEADAFQLIRTMHVLRMNFQMAARTHRLEQTQRFKWIPEDEVIYYLARKHPWLLVQALVAPMLILIPALTATFYFLVTPVGEQGQRSPLLWPALAIAVSSGVWGLWRYIDWSNDYYIVTNRRVLWLERVIGLYDSRNETPLSAVQRINVETDFWGRQLNYGTLTIRTIIGSTLILRNMPHPHQAAALIEEQWRRVQRTARQMEEEEMKQILRERILKGPAPFRPRSVIAKPPPKIDPYKGKRTPSNLFRLRFEEQTTVTYRKHLIIFFRQTGLPMALIFAWIVVLIVLGKYLFPVFGWISVLCGWSIVFLVLFGWWLYQYIDWSNDIFQVTPEQIVDIDKTPFGQMTSDMASLDNILSIEYERHGLLELLLNYGDVKITIGGGKQMVFEDVSNPAAVQDDIERRRLERLARKEQEKERAERERFADWFAAYYRSEQAFRTEQATPAPPPPESPPSAPEKKKSDREW